MSEVVGKSLRKYNRNWKNVFSELMIPRTTVAWYSPRVFDREGLIDRGTLTGGAFDPQSGRAITVTPERAGVRKQNQQYTTGANEGSPDGRSGRPARNISINHASRVRSPRYWTDERGPGRAGRREITGRRRPPR